MYSIRYQRSVDCDHFLSIAPSPSPDRVLGLSKHYRYHALTLLVERLSPVRPQSTLWRRERRHGRNRFAAAFTLAEWGGSKICTTCPTEPLHSPFS